MLSRIENSVYFNQDKIKARNDYSGKANPKYERQSK